MGHTEQSCCACTAHTYLAVSQAAKQCCKQPEDITSSISVWRPPLLSVKYAALSIKYACAVQLPHLSINALEPFQKLAFSMIAQPSSVKYAALECQVCSFPMSSMQPWSVKYAARTCQWPLGAAPPAIPSGQLATSAFPPACTHKAIRCCTICCRLMPPTWYEATIRRDCHPQAMRFICIVSDKQTPCWFLRCHLLNLQFVPEGIRCKQQQQ